MRQRRSSSGEARRSSEMGHIFWVRRHCRGAWLVGWSEALS